MSPRHPRPTHAQLEARGRASALADVVALLRQSITGARAIAAKHRGAGVDEDIDTTLFIARIEALIGTLEAGLHEGLGVAPAPNAGGAW